MAKVAKNVLTRGLSGKLGNLLVFRKSGERTIMSAAPGKRSRPFTEAQELHLQQFKEAVLYAKSVMADADKKAEYEAAAKSGGSMAGGRIMAAVTDTPGHQVQMTQMLSN